LYIGRRLPGVGEPDEPESFHVACAAGLRHRRSRRPVLQRRRRARPRQAAKDELGVEARPSSRRDRETDAGGENREELLKLLAEGGYNPIIGVGFAYATPSSWSPRANPDTTFVIVDDRRRGRTSRASCSPRSRARSSSAWPPPQDRDRRRSASSAASRPADPEVRGRLRAGAEAVNPDIEVDVKYITQPPDFAGFNDPARGKEIADAMYPRGADVVYHAAGGSGGGLFEAAAEAGDGLGHRRRLRPVPHGHGRGEGVHPHLDAQAGRRGGLRDIEASPTATPRAASVVFDLASGRRRLLDVGGYVDDIVDQLDDYKQQIIDGEITVPTAP
jgi:basic membrane protein A and related proteins